jgi:hypothetical protein
MITEKKKSWLKIYKITTISEKKNPINMEEV